MCEVKDIPSDILRLQKIGRNLLLRSKLIFYIRELLFKNGFIELDTPIIVDSPAPEEHIEAFAINNSFLRTSPELHMKRALSAGFKKIFQIGPCFRYGEKGKLHREEFTMLEWYHAGKDYMDLINFTKFIINSVTQKIFGTLQIKFDKFYIDFSKEWEEITVRDAFKYFSNYSIEEAIEKNLFEVILTEEIEPKLPKDRPVIVLDYPAEMAALSKIKEKDPTVSERWELYIGGIEIANTYTELTDPVEQRERFLESIEKREKLGMKRYKLDKEFLEALEYGMPDCAGSALGIDRLAMILSDSKHISDEISFYR